MLCKDQKREDHKLPKQLKPQRVNRGINYEVIRNTEDKMQTSKAAVINISPSDIYVTSPGFSFSKLFSVYLRMKICLISPKTD